MAETIDGALEKALWICKHLLAGGCITKEKLMDEFEISDMSAKRWMSAVARQLDVTASGYLYGNYIFRCKCGEEIEGNKNTDEHRIVCPKCKRIGCVEKQPF